ncbi:MAG: hypothetical protein ACREEK_29340 [Bradyrhizobium sp.]
MALNSLRMGACALQVGHHEAWIEIRIGLPAFCASANALASNVEAVSAKADEVKADEAKAPATSEAIRTERRVNIENSLVYLEEFRLQARECYTPLGSAMSFGPTFSLVPWLGPIEHRKGWRDSEKFVNVVGTDHRQIDPSGAKRKSWSARGMNHIGWTLIGMAGYSTTTLLVSRNANG